MYISKILIHAAKMYSKKNGPIYIYYQLMKVFLPLLPALPFLAKYTILIIIPLK
jgi:hypothetical protein